MVLILVALVLFIVSVLADRVLHAGKLAQWLFGFSCFALFTSIEFFFLDVFVDMPPLDLGFIDSTKWTASKLGGWSLAIAYIYFIAASALGVMFLLALFVDAVEPWWYGFGALISLVCGIVYLVGFFVFFEGLALILGIVATIIGIMVGLRKLLSQKSK